MTSLLRVKDKLPEVRFSRRNPITCTFWQSRSVANNTCDSALDCISLEVMRSWKSNDGDVCRMLWGHRAGRLIRLGRQEASWRRRCLSPAGEDD